MTIVSPPLLNNAVPAVIGHRGSSATHRENTPAAFAYAFATGAQAVELDVIPTADRVLAVTHDFVDGTGRVVYQTRFADLPGICRLEDVLRLGGGVFDIEMKTQPGFPMGAREYARLVHSVVHASGVRARCMVRSFDPELLREMRRIAPELPLAAITANPLVDWVRYSRRAHAACISPHHRLVTRRRVRRAQRAGLYVMPWTANHALSWERLIYAGVNGIITDDPAGLVEYLKTRRPGVRNWLLPSRGPSPEAR